MPPNNTPNSAQQHGARKSTARVIPAVPLALSKPKPSKPQRGVESDAQPRADSAAPNVVPPVTNGLKEQQEQLQPLVNGDDGAQRDTPPQDSVVTMPAVDTPTSRGSAPMSLSFGGTPELPTAESSQPATPPPNQPQSPVSATSLTSSRNMADKFDMRQIKTELPPAFIPSAEQHTPQSATSPHSTRPSDVNLPTHSNHPSTSSVAYGDHGASPAPPQVAPLAFNSPTHPSFGAHQQPYFQPHAHAHHVSEPAFRHYQNAYPGWQGRQNFVQPNSHAASFHPHAHMPFRYPPRDTFTPGAPSPTVNGHTSTSRSPSQTSSATREHRRHSRTDFFGPNSATKMENGRVAVPSHEQRAAFPAQPFQRQAQFQHQMASPLPPAQSPDIAAINANSEALREHVLMLLSDPRLERFKDCQLVITDGIETERSFTCNQDIISRSPVLLDLIERTDSAGKPVKSVSISLQNSYLRIDTLIDCIRYLYGERLLRHDSISPSSAAGETGPSNLERMEKALQTIAMGAWLDVAPIANRALEVTHGLLHWETLAAALAFALDGGLNPVWNVDKSSQERASISSSEESLSRAEPANLPTYDPWSTHLLYHVVDYIVRFFPISFYLDAAAPQLTSCPRLPTLPVAHASRPSRSDPRLTQIRFGDIPSEEHQRPSYITTTFSSILLSVPFPILKAVLEHPGLAARLGPETVASIMRQVVAERENRRNKILKGASPALMSNIGDSQLVQNLYWEESVETSTEYGTGSRLVRRKRDIDTPPSSGACSERNK